MVPNGKKRGERKRVYLVNKTGSRAVRGRETKRAGKGLLNGGEVLSTTNGADGNQVGERRRTRQAPTENDASGEGV